MNPSDTMIEPAANQDAPLRTVSVKEAAAYLGKPDRTVRRWAATGRVDAEQVDVPIAGGVRKEWRIYARSLTQLAVPVSAPGLTGRTPGGRDSVPLALYREVSEKLEGALVQVGQLSETRARLLLAEKSQSTMEADLRAAQETIADLQAQLARRWFKRRRRS